ncbi:hypothetical protein CVS47_02838 [Microbacterium lemovicicum]|uniref:Phage capsid-like C-terminal domain-containing protein n=1 Tax=Microbacterium lemovicicum TaxID=1072463 RepID=A0A3Q9J059_9MICO|nr:phage major capsid protein [Microbacterium lemovicicum]AZS38187.1 hypothetical protein CVS47_02838 [Microbacterium lemovicicum]
MSTTKTYSELLDSGRKARDLAEQLLLTKTDPTLEQLATIEAGQKDAADAVVMARKIKESRELNAAIDALGGPGSKATGGLAGPGFKASARASWAKAVGDRLQTVMRTADGAKALVSGSVDVPSVAGQPVEIAGRPTSVLDLIQKPASPATGQGNAFQYLRQQTRTNNAAAVADGATKPTSVYTFGAVEDTFAVYAHMSEVLPLRYLTDFDGLTDILRDQLGAGLLEAIEADVIAGTGTGDSFTGVLNTSGIQSQAFATDLLTSMSNAKFKLISASQDPTAWVLNPTDAQKLELLRESGSTGAFLFRNGLKDAEAFLGAPIVLSTQMTVGTGLLGDWRTVELLVREDDHVDTDTSGVLFEKNQFRMRVEGRYGLKVGRPLSFVKTALAA